MPAKQLKNQILRASKKAFVPMEVPEWNCTIYLPVATDFINDIVHKFAAVCQVSSFHEIPAYQVAGYIIRDELHREIFTPEEAARLDSSIVKRIIAKFREINAHRDWLRLEPTNFAPVKTDVTTFDC